MSNVASAAAGAAVQGGFGLIGSALNYAFNKKLAEQQNQFNLDMWKMQNEYNSPQAQMQRYQEAGLNPLLIYGQGSNGNATSAPEQVVPSAPHIDKDLQEVGKLFNLINLRSAAADAEKKENEAYISDQVAKQENIKTKVQKADYDSMITMGWNYDFDPVSGRYIYKPYNSNLYGIKEQGPGEARYFTMKRLEENYKNNYLIPYRRATMQYQNQFMIPQIRMKEFDWKHYPQTFYIDRADIKNPAGLIYGLWDHWNWNKVKKGILDLF